MKITSSGERAVRPGPADWFTGAVEVEGLVGSADLGGGARLQSALVRFSPGARTHWHTHPVGQTLYVVSGRGWAQLEGESAREISPGDVVAIAAGENHWHGASAGEAMSHVAMQEGDETGSVVVWGRAVTDAEFEADV
jgi:quercetin dioxygenase-like cupin family protein